MTSRIDTAKQEVLAALAAINTFLDSEPADTVDVIYCRHMVTFRLILDDMLASLEGSGDFVPVADRNMGYPIIDSWPLPHHGLDETKAALAAVGQQVAKAENAYRRAASAMEKKGRDLRGS
jgi:hypothetical protein